MLPRQLLNSTSQQLTDYIIATFWRTTVFSSPKPKVYVGFSDLQIGKTVAQDPAFAFNYLFASQIKICTRFAPGQPGVRSGSGRSPP